MYIDACLGVVPWSIFLIFGEVVAVSISSFEVAINTTI